jgi:hypothetical protein
MERRSLATLAAVLALGGLGVFLLRGRRGEAPKVEERAEAPAEVVPEAPLAVSSGARRAVESEPDYWRTIHVFAHDLEQAPVAGARVGIATEAGPVEAVTGEDGRCTFTLDWQEWLEIEATAPGHLGWKERTQWRDELELELPRACTLVGRVLDADTREPVVGAQVSISPRNPRWVSAWPSADADAGGAFRLGPVPASRKLDVAARAQGYADLNSIFDVSRAGDPVLLELLLVHRVKLDVQVLEEPSGLPIAGASVNEFPTDAEGRATIDADQQPDGILRVYARAEGHCTISGPVRREDVGSEPLILRLPLLGRFEGIVRDERGVPLSGAELAFDEHHFVEPSSPDELWKPSLPELPTEWSYWGEISVSVESDAEGRFVSPDLFPSPRTYDVRVTHPGGAELHASAGFIVPGASTKLELQPTRIAKGRLEGRVLLNGAPVEGGLRWKNGARTGGAWIKDGAYQDEVDAGRIDVTVRIDDPDYSLLDPGVEGLRATVEVGEGETVRKDFDIVLTLGTISGRLSSEDGRPLQGELVSLEEANGRLRRWARAESDGRWQQEVVDLGWEYRVIVEHGGETREVAGVHAGDTHVDFVLPVLGELALRVFDESTGRPIRSWEVACRRLDAPEHGWVLRNPTVGRKGGRPDGSHSMELLAGEYELCVQASEGDYVPQNVERVVVAAGQASEPVEVRLEHGHALDIELDDGVGVPPAESWILVVEPELWADVLFGDDVPDASSKLGGTRYRAGPLSGHSFAGRFVFFSDGHRARLTGLPAGELRFKAFPPSLVIEPATVVLPRAEPLAIRWRME